MYPYLYRFCLNLLILYIDAYVPKGLFSLVLNSFTSCYEYRLFGYLAGRSLISFLNYKSMNAFSYILVLEVAIACDTLLETKSKFYVFLVVLGSFHCKSFLVANKSSFVSSSKTWNFCSWSTYSMLSDLFSIWLGLILITFDIYLELSKSCFLEKLGRIAWINLLLWFFSKNPDWAFVLLGLNRSVRLITYEKLC